MMADDIADRLVAQGLGTKGVDIFRSFDPGRPDDAILIYRLGGAGFIDAMGAQAKVIEQPTAHIIVRGKKPSDAETKANQVVLALHKYVGTLNGTRYLFIRALQSPLDVGPDENGRTRYAINFRVTKELSA